MSGTFFHRIARQVLYCGLSRKTYSEIAPKIRQKNDQAIRWASALGTLIMSALAVSALFIEVLRANFALYAAAAAVCLTVLVLCRFFLPCRQEMVLPCFYLLLIAFYIFGIINSVLQNRDTPATTFCVLLVVIPLLLTDKPYRITLLMIAATLAFILSSYAVKPEELFQHDLVNGVSFLIAGIGINFFLLRTKLHEQVQRSVVEHQRDTDALTGLMTRSAAEQIIRSYLDGTGASGALMILDIDDFKKINDACGHERGDEVLRKMATCLRSSFRRNDIPARMGGDEFFVFLPGATDQMAVRTSVVRLVDEAAKTYPDNGELQHVSASVGIAFCPADSTDYEELFRKADAALYASKRSGKRSCTYASALENAHDLIQLRGEAAQ